MALTLRVHLSSGHGRHRRHRTVTLRLGSASLSLAAGQRATVHVRLTATARKVPVAPLGTFPQLLTLPADNDTWSVTVFTSAGDQPLKRLRARDLWTAVVVAACPRHAHWLDGEPTTDVVPHGRDDRRPLPPLSRG